MMPNSRYMIYRVTQPGRLATLTEAIGTPILEAVRIPGRQGSIYRVWTRDGQCYEIPKVALGTQPPMRREHFDRVARGAA